MTMRAAAAAAALCLSLAGTAAGMPYIDAPQGRSYGVAAAKGVYRYAGLPFAVPPVGDQRFRRSQVNTATYPRGEYDARFFRAPCIQNPNGDPNETPDPEAPPPSEDCLHANIWTPRCDGGNASSTPAAAPLRPVMMWVFGGGMCAGSAANRGFNGSNLAAEGDVVVVTVNYRLGALGFLVMPDGFHPDGGSGGMNGVFDLVTALRWIRDNIAAYGGDPNNVTVFGQSSGGYATCILSASEPARGLFRRAILESGPCVGGWGPWDAAVRGAALTQQVLADVNASSVQALMSVDAHRVQWPHYLMFNLTIAPYFSGYFTDSGLIPGDGTPETVWRTGDVVPEELIIGYNSKDGTAAYYGTAPLLGLVPPDVPEHSEADYYKRLGAAWGGPDNAAKVAAQYPTVKYGSIQAAFIQADADAYVICPQYRLSEYLQKRRAVTNKKVFMYEFAHFMPGHEDPWGRGFGCDNGVELDVVHPSPRSYEVQWATHGAETKYVFGVETFPDGLGPPHNISHCPFNAEERVLSKEMMKAWTRFARHGHPTEREDQWREFTTSNFTRFFTTQAAAGGGGSSSNDYSAEGYMPPAKQADCDFWRTNFPTMQAAVRLPSL